MMILYILISIFFTILLLKIYNYLFNLISLYEKTNLNQTIMNEFFM